MERFYISYLGLFVGMALSAFGQSTINGAIREPSGKALPFATVALINATDSTNSSARPVQASASDGNGFYSFANVRAGHYVLVASAVGYQKNRSGVLDLGADATNQTPLNVVLTLPEATENLKEIQVTAKKPFVEQQIDRMIINVAGSIVGSGSTALEVLAKVPGVTIDYQSESIQLRGKDGVIVQIDGKQSYLSAQDVMALLRSLSSDNIDKIEVITNPSARYDAAGNSGILNIRLKKNRDGEPTSMGTNGTLSLAAGTGRFDRERGSLQVNHRTSNWNLFSSYSLNRGSSYWNLELARNQPDQTQPNSRNLVNQLTQLTFSDLGHVAKAGADYSLSKQTTVGMVWTGFWSNHREQGPASTAIRRAADEPIYLQTTTDKTLQNQAQNQLINLNMQHTFGEKQGQRGYGQLTADIDAGHFNRDFANRLITQTVISTNGAAPPIPALLNTMPTTINILTVKADYAHSLQLGWRLEAGLKHASVQTDNNFQLNSGPIEALQPDTTASNHFQYTERVNALYASISGKFQKTNVQFGLRAEHTHSVGNSLTLHQTVIRDYLNLFPALFVSQPVTPNQTLTFSYSYRIDRPNYQNLNPARTYVDPYAYRQGNAYLRPQYTHALELKYGYKSGVFLSLAASYISDLSLSINHVTEGNKIYRISQNTGNSQGYTMTLSFPLTLVKGWQLQTNLVGYYNQFQFDYEQQPFRAKNVAGRINLANGFTFGKGWTAELTGWISTPAINTILELPWLGSADAGLQKSLSSNLKVKVSAQDIFHTNWFKSTINAPASTQHDYLMMDTRVVLFTLNYSFGNQRLKATRQRRSSSEEEEMKRAN